MVKVCGITNEEDARVAVEAGATALGFNFYRQSSRYVSPARAAEIAGAVEGEYLRVGVFVNAEERELERIFREVPLDVVQLHGRACRTGLRAWRALPAEHAAVEAGGAFEAYLLDTPSESYGGSGETFDWALAAGFPYKKIVAGGLDAGNVASAIRMTAPWGVDACSRLEERPGKKDARKVREFVAAALAAAVPVGSAL